MSAISKKIDMTNIDDPSACAWQPHWEHYPVTLDNWKAACTEEKRKRNISFAEIARRIGYARPSLSLALNGKYTGDTKTIANAYIEYRRVVLCPYTKTTVQRAYCDKHAAARPPTHNPAELRHWRACQGCEHNPLIEGARDE